MFVGENSPYLMDRTGRYCLATTDPAEKYIFISATIKPDMLEKVVIHEIGHCVLFSFGLLSDIHRMVRPECQIEAEEYICNILADYGKLIYTETCNFLYS